MYSNDSRNGFSLADILVKIIFAGLFIFVLIWLFNKNVPNMEPFYSNVFRENIKYMQEAGESYFTDDKMPKNVGDTVKITLSEMFDKKLILPFVDQDGNSCNQYDSYVSVTKTSNNYELKTNLVCNKETNYTVKILGCHTYCENGNCNENKCVAQEITKYQYKKEVTKTTTKYSCPKGYTLKNKYCYKNELVSEINAELVKTSVKDTKQAKSTIVSPEKVLLKTLSYDDKVYTKRIKTTSPSTTETVRVSYSCTKTEKQCSTTTTTEKKCTTTTKTESYSCNCTSSVGSTGKAITKCSTCYKTVPVETCTNVPKSTETCKNVSVNSTCYRDETRTVPGSTTYSCPYGYKWEGSGSSLRCYKYETEYSCPSNSNYHEGSGRNLKCYKVKDGSVTYSCDHLSGYTLSGSSCVKNITTEKYSCDKLDGYKLDGTKCKKYSTDKVAATATKKTTKSYKYTWSEKTSLSGWVKTGKTKVVKSEENCK